ncbi:hypothetical protein KAU51_03800 [Candidatus Parcubacteria bacterium]|nr:hypothetical protein [Candidatus Parcubacteria bacterium]
MNIVKVNLTKEEIIQLYSYLENYERIGYIKSDDEYRRGRHYNIKNFLNSLEPKKIEKENSKLLKKEIGNYDSDELFRNHPEVEEMIQADKNIILEKDLQLFSVTMWFRCPKCGGESIAPDTKCCPDCGIKIERKKQ